MWSLDKDEKYCIESERVVFFVLDFLDCRKLHNPYVVTILQEFKHLNEYLLNIKNANAAEIEIMTGNR